MSRTGVAAWFPTILVLFLTDPVWSQLAPPRSDRYGDPLPPGAVARLGTARFRQGYFTYHVAFSPDGKTVAAASAGQGVCLWNAASGQRRLQVLPGAHCYSVAFSPDGKTLASTGRGLRLWDAATGTELRSLGGNSGGETMVVVFAPDGKTLASGGHDKLVRIWDAATGMEIKKLEGHQQSVLSLAFAPDGKTLASAGLEDSFRLWNVATGAERLTLKGHQKQVTSVAFSADGKLLASASEDETVRLWEPSSGKLLRALEGIKRGAQGLAFSADGKMVAVGDGEGTITLWDPADGQRLRSWQGHSYRVQSLAFAPDGKTLVTTAVWMSGPSLWDTATGKLVHAFAGHRSPVDLLAFTPDGKTLLSQGRDKVLLRWDLARQQATPVVQWQIPTLDRVQISADGRTAGRIGFRGGPVHLWDTVTGREIHVLDQPPLPEGVQSLAPLAFSPDGELLAAADGDATIQLWDPASGARRRQLRVVQGPISSLAFSPDGKLLAVICGIQGPAVIRLLDVASSKETRVLDNGEAIGGLRFSPDGNMLATSGVYVERVKLWSVATGKELRRLQKQAEHSNYVFAFSADGRFLVGGTEAKGSAVRVWEVLTGQEAYRFEGHLSGICSACFTADGRTLVTGGSDSMILIWDLTHADPPGVRAAVELGALWNDLAAADGERACRAVWKLARAPSALAYLKDRLHPVAEITAEQQKQVARWLQELDSDEFAVREKAGAELGKLGLPARPFLKQALEGKPSLEVQRRVQALLENLDSDVPMAEQVRLLRAVQVLEYSGSAPARQILDALSKGAAEARLTVEARAALGRLAGR